MDTSGGKSIGAIVLGLIVLFILGGRALFHPDAISISLFVVAVVGAGALTMIYFD